MMLNLIAGLAGFCYLQQVALAEPKVVPMQFTRTQSTGPSLRRRDPISASLANNLGSGQYSINATVGTPPQNVVLQVDTGSSDVWVISSSAYGSSNCSQNMCFGGSFDPSKSKSNQLNKDGSFVINYADNSGVTGDYMTDTFGFSGKSVSNLTMGYATTVLNGIQNGIMGIGFDTDESAASGGSPPYPSVVDSLMQQNLIASRSYSLYLNDLSDSSGTILFGGYDTDKYSGELTVLDIQPDAQSGTISSMTVAWTFLGVTTPKGQTRISNNTFAVPAVLDSGTTLTALPTDIYNGFVQAFQPDSNGLVPCDLGQGSFDFGFGGVSAPQISVPFSELAVPAYSTTGSRLTFSDGSQACQFGFSDASQVGVVLLGDTFLRSAYVVYDLDAQIIGIAPTIFNSGSSNIKQIPAAGASASPLGTSVSLATAAGVTQTASKGPLGPVGGGSVTSMASVSSATKGSGNGQPTGATTSYAVMTPQGAAPAASGSGTSSGSSPASSSKGAAAGVSPLAGTSHSFALVVAAIALVAGGFASGLAVNLA